jgi:2-C-methyl-D-erythritol 2,4-cyclodiphosphate synthase
MTAIRIGQGYDVHDFCAGDHIVLGGVTIPHNKAFKAHSDGDVLLHALCDALLGALALGDIGQHFPDTSVEFENINSRILLKNVYQLITDKGWQIGNIDSTIIAQSPKLAAHIPQMCLNMSEDLAIDQNQVSVKATTTEKLGFAGRKEGIAVHVIVLLVQ